MRIPAKILAILILLTAVFTVIACDTTHLSTGDITTTTTTTLAYTVTFDSQFNNVGIATTMPIPAYETVTPPATTINALPTPPTMSGYIFGGWWTGIGDSGAQFTASTPVTSDLIVYAYWYQYRVTFNSDSSIFTFIDIIPPATTVGALPTPPTKLSYNFAGWYEMDGVTEFFANTPVTANTTVTAKWVANTVHTVTYDSNGGTAVGAQYVISSATTVGTLPPIPPAQLFYNFAGWYESDGVTEFTASTPVTADITVTAQWNATPGYTVTYNRGWGGTSVGAQYVILPATTVGALPTPPTKQCYTFGGWWTEENGGGTQFTASTPVTADITVYAQWTWGLTTTPSTYAIGDPGPSCVGKVFYITDGGLHGLEAAPPGWYGDWYGDPYANNGQDPYSVWIYGDPETVLNGNTSTAIGTGKKNSDAIIAQAGSTASWYSAAALCEDYSGGNFDDWFLPSKDELAQLYAQRDAGQWGGFTEDTYWSSSEYDAGDAWSQYFTDGTQTGAEKSNNRLVRAIRAF